MRMISEVKYTNFCGSGLLQDDITLGEFVRLYYNHRPLDSHPGDRELLHQYFGEICRLSSKADQDVDRMQWRYFEDLLRRRGEKIGTSEMRSCLHSVAGNGSLPLEVSASRLERDLLGVEEQELF